MKYRKKPVVIEALQWTGERPRCMFDFLTGQFDQYMTDRGENFHLEYNSGGAPILIIHTLEGEMRADIGDYIIKGVKGEYYPCKPDIFARTYDPVLE